MSINFSSDEATALEKQIDNRTELINTRPEQLNSDYEITRCIDWIEGNNFKKICLQFPDHLLNDSTEVAACLQDSLNEPVYIMGDTAYGSCCVDYVTAAHVNADAIIHFGPVCLSKAFNNIPCLYIYEKKPLDTVILRDAFNNYFYGTTDLTVIVDAPYLVHFRDILDAVDSLSCIVCSIFEIELDLSDRTVIFVGNSLRKITNIDFTYKPKQLLYYDADAVPEIVNFQHDLKILKRRYFLIEKIKDSRTIGIVIGTVVIKNYLRIIERIKRLIRINKKKYYVISVGKPTVAKLANFSEIDIYVVISCVMNEIYDSRDFYKPIVTPFDIEFALNPGASELSFSYDYNSFLPANDLTEDDLEQLSNLQQNDVSLLTGNIRSNDVVAEELNDNRLALKTDGTVSVNSFGAGFLSDRSWKGLEQNLGCDEPKIASEGRRGLAQSYINEEQEMSPGD